MKDFIMKFILTTFMLCAISVIAQEDYDYFDPDMDTPIDSPISIEDAHIEVDVPALNPIAPTQIDVVPATAANTASEVEVTVPDYVQVDEAVKVSVETPNYMSIDPVQALEIAIEPFKQAIAVAADPIEVAAIVMMALVDQPQVVIDAIQQLPLLQQFDVPFYEMFRSGKMQWVAKQLKIAELSGDTERAAKLHKELVGMLRKWMIEEDITEPPHD